MQLSARAMDTASATDTASVPVSVSLTWAALAGMARGGVHAHEVCLSAPRGGGGVQLSPLGALEPGQGARGFYSLRTT